MQYISYLNVEDQIMIKYQSVQNVCNRNNKGKIIYILFLLYRIHHLKIRVRKLSCIWWGATPLIFGWKDRRRGHRRGFSSNTDYKFGATDRRILFITSSGGFKYIECSYISSIETETETDYQDQGLALTIACCRAIPYRRSWKHCWWPTICSPGCGWRGHITDWIVLCLWKRRIQEKTKSQIYYRRWVRSANRGNCLVQWVYKYWSRAFQYSPGTAMSRVNLSLCHRRSGRYLSIRGYEFPIRARCTAIYFGYITALIFETLVRSLIYKITLVVRITSPDY